MMDMRKVISWGILLNGRIMFGRRKMSDYFQFEAFRSFGVEEFIWVYVKDTGF